MDAVDSLGRLRDQPVGQILGGGDGEKAGMGEGDPVELRMECRAHVRVGMAKAGDRRSPEPWRKRRPSASTM